MESQNQFESIPQNDQHVMTISFVLENVTMSEIKSKQTILGNREHLAR